MYVYKIVDYIKLQGIGEVYFLDGCKQTVLRLDDILHDSSGNRFRVKSFEMINRHYDDMDIEDIPVAMRFDNIDGVSIAGINTYLYKE